MKKRVADIIMDILVEQGITDCFAVVGGGAMHIDNALGNCTAIRKIFCHHEQACAMAAESYAKATGKMALVSVTSGPGALNTLNGVEGAWVDNTPMIVIAGHPRLDTTIEETGLNLRYRGVQEFDIVTSVKNMTKYAVLLKDPLAVRSELRKAIKIAMTGRKGPVWISIPLDVQSRIIETSALYSDEVILDERKVDLSAELKKLNEMLKRSKRPCILTGTGIRYANAVNSFRQWSEAMNIPVVGGSLIGDISYEGEKNYYGSSGTNGSRRGNFILQNADLMIVIGNSLSTKQTGFDQLKFAPNTYIAMVDIEADEMKKPGLHVELPIVADIKEFLNQARKYIDPWEINLEWINYCDNLENVLGNIDKRNESNPNERVSQYSFWTVLREKLPDDGIVALGNSSCICAMLQMGIKFPEQRVIVNYNSGSMGDDLPEAVGIAIGTNKTVILGTGDGSIMMNLQELQTITHYQLPIKIIVFSNDGYGAIRNTQNHFFEGHYVGCDEKTGISFPKFEDVAKTFGMDYKCCKTNDEIESSIQWLLEENGARILEVKQKLIDPPTPKLQSKMLSDGTFVTPALQDLEPFLDDSIINGLMLPTDVLK
ncbi:MAG: thiamine pyrophosphate-binding protein [Eubacterium sp.]|nr:thiamine pyrophosphate-binding protein [Eubacterium sp.]